VPALTRSAALRQALHRGRGRFFRLIPSWGARGGDPRFFLVRGRKGPAPRCKSSNCRGAMGGEGPPAHWGKSKNTRRFSPHPPGQRWSAIPSRSRALIAPLSRRKAERFSAITQGRPALFLHAEVFFFRNRTEWGHRAIFDARGNNKKEKSFTPGRGCGALVPPGALLRRQNAARK